MSFAQNNDHIKEIVFRGPPYILNHNDFEDNIRVWSTISSYSEMWETSLRFPLCPGSAREMMGFTV